MSMVGNYTLRICPEGFVLIAALLGEQCHICSLYSDMFILVCFSRMCNSFWFLKYILLEMHSYVFIEGANGQVLTRKEWQIVFLTKMSVVFQVQLLMLHMFGGIQCVSSFASSSPPVHLLFFLPPPLFLFCVSWFAKSFWYLLPLPTLTKVFLFWCTMSCFLFAVSIEPSFSESAGKCPSLIPFVLCKCLHHLFLLNLLHCLG